jgi:hypothetical protein
MKGEIEIRGKVDAVYNEIVGWSKNIFTVPKGKAGSDFIEEIARLLDEFNFKSQWQNLAISLVHIFMPLMLQKPQPRSKPRDNTKYLQKRLLLWTNGDLDGLLKEAREIQKRLHSKVAKKDEDSQKAFCRLMLAGKISKALKFINNDQDATAGIHSLDDGVIRTLEEKHPNPGRANEDALLDRSSIDTPEPVIFEPIDAEEILKSAKTINGSGGPTNIDAEIWQYMLCSKFHEKQSKRLAQSIADFTKILCAENVDPQILQEFLAGRLIPLKKNPDGIRPIGVGEALRRIVAKTVTRILRNDIQQATGTLQTCSGIEAGIEAAVHAMRDIFMEDDTEALLLVDAKNAFNSLNREVALNNIAVICPTFHRFLNNSYQCPSKLFIVDSQMTSKEVQFIYSKEGATQGDPAAMAMYALGTRPLMDILEQNTMLDTDQSKQVFYADDASAAGKLEGLKHWWEELCKHGPDYGYYTNASKTVLIVKKLENLPTARVLFGKTGVTITLKGERHLGAVIGSEEFRCQYVTEKIDAWIKDVEELAEIAKEEPQLAYSAYTKGLSHRWTYLQRTVPNISPLFEPLENAIRNTLIPAMLGRKLSDLERSIVALPLRYGGLGIQNPVLIADQEFQSSNDITNGLKQMIYIQDKNLENLDRAEIASKKQLLKDNKDTKLKEEYDLLKNQLPAPRQRAFIEASQKGASSWLTALPIRRLGFCLNKAEFRDAMALRYNWPITDIHSHCACGSKNDIDHVLVCKLGGYVTFRHNALRDTEAELLREVCRDVKTEPLLLPTNKKDHPHGTITNDQARLDIAATGLWGTFERTFFDVRVTHSGAKSNSTVPLEQLLKRNENEKKRKYSSRVINTEKSSFVPLVYSTAGSVAPECEKHHKRLAEMISNRRKEKYADIINFVRTKVRFALLKSVLMAVRGIRGRNTNKYTPIADIPFGLIPCEQTYECR